MRYVCDFQHRQTGECKSVPVTLTAEQIQSVKAIRADGDAAMLSEAYALNIAYREVPEGFLHTKPPTAVALQ